MSDNIEYKIIPGNKIATYVPSGRLRYDDTIVQGDFYCSDTRIVTLEGCPIEVGGVFSCSNNPDLDSLKGCPRSVGGDFYCQHTNITTLKDIHKYIDRIGRILYISGNIESHILGILKIKEVVRVVRVVLDNGGDARLFAAVLTINKYLDEKPNPRDRDIHKCQEEMIEAGLAEYAQL